jgi:hypothetical protein
LRYSVLVDGMRFDASIGPRGISYAMGSETELVRRLLRSGHQAWHVRDAVVEHFIRREQMDKAWVLNRAIRFGRGQYRLAMTDGGRTRVKTWWGTPRHLIRQLAQEYVAILAAASSGDARRLFRARWDLNYVRGAIIEARSALDSMRAESREGSNDSTSARHQGRPD